jgi:hypothetical protein
MAEEIRSRQLPHPVFGAELERLDEVVFRDVEKLDIVGIYPNSASACAAWKAMAQPTVDAAQTRHFIVHPHRLLDPGASAPVSML